MLKSNLIKFLLVFKLIQLLGSLLALRLELLGDMIHMIHMIHMNNIINITEMNKLKNLFV
jgi:hypothetical protein